MGQSAKPLLKDLESDKEGPYFYTSSARRVLGVLQSALAIAERQVSATSSSNTDSPAKELNVVWGPVRAVLQDNFDFADIKKIVGLAGIDLTNLSHLDQKPGGGASKGQLMTTIDGLYGHMLEGNKQRFITIVTEEVLQRQPAVNEPLQSYLARLGWATYEGKIVPVEILDISELPELPSEARPDLVKAAQRLRDGDLSGAISAACGAVDTITNRIYRDKSLGDPNSASFQERVSSSLKAHDVMTHLDEDLTALGWDIKEIKPFRENLVKSLNQAAYVMQTLRANMGDVHGSKPILKPLVFDSLKWAALIIRLLA